MRNREPALWLSGFVLFALLRFYVVGLPHACLVDDAYITLRYVRNFLDAGVLHWNIGTPILGISTLLYPWVLVIASYLLYFVDLETCARLTNLGLEYLSLFLCTSIYRRMGVSTGVAVLMATAVVYNVTLQCASSGGMEAALFMALLLAIVAYIDRWPRIAAVCAGLLYFTRPEGIVAVAFVSAIGLWKKRWDLVLLTPSFVLAYHAILWVAYGTLVPGSVEVKAAFPEALGPWEVVLYFLNLTGLLLPAGSLSFYLRLGVVAFFSIWGALAWRPKGLGFWMLLAFLAVYIGFYALGHPYMKFWYVAPFTTGSALLFFYGLWQSSQRLRVGAPVLVLALLAIVAAELRWVYFIDGTVLDQYTRRIAIYQKVVDDLKARYPVTAETTMLTHEIGAFGFEWPGRVYDVVGLVNPEQAKLGYTQVAGHTQFGVVTRAWIDLQRPDFILIQENYLARDVRDWPDFYRDYALLYKVPDTEFTARSGELLVYAKRSLAPKSRPVSPETGDGSAPFPTHP